MKKSWWAVLVVATVASFALAFTDSILSPVGYFGFYLGAVTSIVIWYFDYSRRIRGYSTRKELDYLFLPKNLIEN